VEVEFAGERTVARAGADGSWRADLKAMPACRNPRTLTVRSGGEELKIADVLVGEVWLCSGQSNMGVPFWGESPRARDRNGYIVGQITRREHIRCARLGNGWSVKPRLDQKVSWSRLTPEYLVNGGFSAVAIWFALTVDSALADVPIGLLGAYVGATGIDAWTPRSVYARYPELKDIADYPMTENWTRDMTVGPLNGANQQPTCYFNGKLASIVPYSMRGVLWYQGEHNVSNNEWKRYRMKMHALYDGLSAEFENPALKLYFAQLAPWGNPDVPHFQMEQEKFTDEQPNAGMAYICDTGNLRDIHPNDKESVGRRLALIALKRDYGLGDIVADAPRLASARLEGQGRVRLRFSRAREMFALDPAWCYKGDPAKSAELGFELAGADGKFRPARIENLRKLKTSVEYRGQMDGEGIVLFAPEVPSPVRVRHLHRHPWFGRITNEAGLPLGPFDADVVK
jgi:sialate O-acetylesterase